MKKLSLPLLFVCGACAGGGSGGQWLKVGELERPERDPDEEYDAVFLLKERDVEFKAPKVGTKTMDRHHYAVVVLTEDGRDQYSDLKIRIPKKAEIIGFEARTIKSDGSVIEVEPTDIKVDESEDDDGVEVHTLFMPKVDVGSILEWRFTRSYPYAWGAHEEYLNDSDVPVKRTKFTIRGDKGVRYTARPYNMPPGTDWKIDTNGGQWRLSTDLRELEPIDDDEWYRPTRERIDPWIAYSTRQIVKGTDVYDWSRTWNEALDWRAAALYWNSSDWYAGAEMDVDVADCGDARCKMKKDLAWLRAELPIRGTGELPGRKAKTSIEVGSATVFEKTRIMHALLEQQGIESLFALGRRHHDGPVDEEVPTYLGFKYMLLQVPAQDGVKKAMWLDPGCEYCEVGEVNRAVNGMRVAVIEPTSVAVGGNQGKIDVQFLEVEAPRPKLGWAYKRSSVALSSNGAASVREVHIGTNDVAQSRRNRRRLRDSKKWEENWEKYVASIDETARLTDWTAETYDEDGDKSTSRLALQMDNYAIPTEDELIVPLRLVQSFWDERFETEDRVNKIQFKTSARYRDQFVFEFPDGYRLVEMPKDESFGESPMVARIEWEKTKKGLKLTRTLKTRRGRYDTDVHPGLKETLRRFRAVKNESLRLTRQD